MSTIIKGLEWIGGRWWRCVKCQRTIAADCSCCEPPACGCSMWVFAEGYEMTNAELYRLLRKSWIKRLLRI